MSISNLSGGSIAALAALRQSPNGPGSTGQQDNPLKQLFGGGEGGGPLQMLQMLGSGSPLAQVLQGGAGDAMSMMQGLQGGDDDGDDSDSDSDDDLA